MRESLTTAACRADNIFYSHSELDKKMRDMMDLIKGLALQWVEKGYVT